MAASAPLRRSTILIRKGSPIARPIVPFAARVFFNHDVLRSAAHMPAFAQNDGPVTARLRGVQPNRARSAPFARLMIWARRIELVENSTVNDTLRLSWFSTRCGANSGQCTIWPGSNSYTFAYSSYQSAYGTSTASVEIAVRSRLSPVMNGPAAG